MQSGDAPFVLVTRFGVTLEDLLGVQRVDRREPVPVPGHGDPDSAGRQVGGRVLAGANGSSDATADTSGDTADGTPRPLRPRRFPTPATTARQGTYTIVEGDYAGKVAEKFDVTVDASTPPMPAPPATARSTPASRSSSPPKPTADAVVWHAVGLTPRMWMGHWKTKLVSLTTSMVALLAIE